MNDLKTNIKTLIELQTIDLETAKLHRQIEESRSELENRSKALAEKRETMARYEERLQACEGRRRELEAMMEDEQARIKDRQTKLMNVQTNREYQSLLKEIEDAKALNKQREDETMLLLEEIDSLKGKITELTNVSTSEEALYTEESGRVEKLNADLSAQQEEINKNRNAIAQRVNTAYIRKYEILRERRGGLAVVGVTNGVCLGCNMNIPPQLYNNLLRERDLLTCPTCNRMMYYLAGYDKE